MYGWGSSSAVAEGRRGRGHAHRCQQRGGVDRCGITFAGRWYDGAVSAISCRVARFMLILVRRHEIFNFILTTSRIAKIIMKRKTENLMSGKVYP